MRYLGGKTKMLPAIKDVIAHHAKHVVSVIDIFAGTGCVSNFFKSLGMRVTSNDSLYFSYVLLRGGAALNQCPHFKGLNLASPLEYLNNLTLEQSSVAKESCFVAKNYSPMGESGRMYLTEDNALRIDVIRQTIQRWYDDKDITEDEFYYLLGCLINAVPYVSNITGTYAAFLKYWDKRAFKKLTLEPPVLVDNSQNNQAFNKDYHDVLKMEGDLMYADPPYNERDYLSNYHLLETIARYDSPIVKGVTGQRPQNGAKSLFCSRRTVEKAFEDLIGGSRTRYLLISYNNEGLMPTSSLIEMCKEYALDGTFVLTEFPFRRYKNKIPNNKRGLKEQLFFMQLKN